MSEYDNFDDEPEVEEPEDLAGPPDDSDEDMEDSDSDDEPELAGEEAQPKPRQRAEVLVLPPDQWTTPDFLSKNEMASVLAERSEQISRFANIFLPDGAEPCSHDPVELAKQELKAGLCPLVLVRVVSHGKTGSSVVEHRAVRDLELLATNLD